MTSNGSCQDTSMAKMKTLEITFGTFNTFNASNIVAVNPAISGYFGDYYFENRYNYEADNSASVNVGKHIFKKLKHVELIPMAGLVFGSFRAITTELQTSLDYDKWTLSTDNQFSFEYTHSAKSLYLNWGVAGFKLTRVFHIGVTSVITKQVNQKAVFDKGVTAAMLFKKWGLRFYAFNSEKEKRYYWLSVCRIIRVRP